MTKQKLRQSIYATFILAALVIITDFALPGKVVNDEILNVEMERQQYYNAARNSHYTYKVITSQHEFYVAENFAAIELKNQQIEYSVSRIFKEVNWYRLLTSTDKSTYSLRVLSGLIVPLLTIISILIAYRIKLNIGTLVFVLQALLLADLIYLIM